MLLKSAYVIASHIPTKNVIKIDDNIEICVIQLDYLTYQFKVIKGNCKLNKITYFPHHSFYRKNIATGICEKQEYEVAFCKKDHLFQKGSLNTPYNFYLEIETIFQKVVPYDLHISKESLDILKPQQYLQQIIHLPQSKTFKCLIKKIADFSFYEIHILNPEHVIINDQKNDYRKLIKMYRDYKVDIKEKIVFILEEKQ